MYVFLNPLMSVQPCCSLEFAQPVREPEAHRVGVLLTAAAMPPHGRAGSSAPQRGRRSQAHRGSAWARPGERVEEVLQLLRYGIGTLPLAQRMSRRNGDTSFRHSTERYKLD